MTPAADLGPWQPLALDEVVDLFAAFPGRWWVAGGHAIELAVGRTVRAEHADVDVAVTRPDHRALHPLMTGWELWAADPPGTLRRWWPGEELPPAVHDIWCRRETTGPWRVQLMIDEVDFRAALPVLAPDERAWLREVITPDHPWRASLT